MSIKDNPDCSFCKLHMENIPHLFFECDKVSFIWSLLYNWIRNRTGFIISINKSTILLGHIYPHRYTIPLNTINMITKSYIFYCSIHNCNLNIYHLQQRIKTSIQNLEFTATLNNKIEKFKNVWDPFKNIFSEE